jgi:hypothetical protein
MCNYQKRVPFKCSPELEIAGSGIGIALENGIGLTDNIRKDRYLRND